MSETFWRLLTWACVAWYSTLTLYVAVKGLADIKKMLSRLRRPEAEGPGNDPGA
jgi:hypothetical protein